MCGCEKKNVLTVGIKKLIPEATIPKYAKPGDVGMDMFATSVEFEEKYIQYRTGISVEIPEGYVGLLFPRSSVSKKDLLMCNPVGCVDAGYRGEVCFRFKRTEFPGDIYEVGVAIGQIVIMPFPYVQFVEKDELSETVRGEGGFGHTGNN